MIGTATYMAPERLETGRRGPASDVYAFAAVAYELLSGFPIDEVAPGSRAAAGAAGAAAHWPGATAAASRGRHARALAPSGAQAGLRGRTRDRTRRRPFAATITDPAARPSPRRRGSRTEALASIPSFAPTTQREPRAPAALTLAARRARRQLESPCSGAAPVAEARSGPRRQEGRIGPRMRTGRWPSWIAGPPRARVCRGA